MDISRNQKGFTLIELIIVFVVVGILVSVATMRYVNLTRNAADGTARGILGCLRTQNAFIFSQRILRGTTASYTMRYIANSVRELKGFNWTAAATRFTLTIRGNTYRFTLTPTPRAPTTYGSITAGTGTFRTW